MKGSLRRPLWVLAALPLSGAGLALPSAAGHTYGANGVWQVN